MMAEASRPTIHWISPVSPARTDIAHYTSRILPALTKIATVVVWTDATVWDPTLERLCQVRHIDPDGALPVDLVRAAHNSGSSEAVFIHIGNSWVFHSGLLRLARRIPAVIVLHDLAIQELLIDSVTNGLFDRATYLSEMEAWYGPKGRACLEDSSTGGATLGSKMPGFEICLNMAHSVLTHTKVAHDAVRARTKLPTHHLELPFAAGESPSFKRLRYGPLRLLQFGFIGPNRRLEQMLEAIAGMQPDFDFVFDIMGQVWNPNLIRRKISELGLEGRVTLHGFVPEAVLNAALRQAHLVLNLRYPTMGEASGSQLRIWNAGAAAAVSNEGWYGDLPAETVFKIDVSDEKNQLQTLLRRLAADRGSTSDVGRAGHARLLKHHNTEDYAQSLIRIADGAGQEAASALQRRAINRLKAKVPVTALGSRRADASL
jgi:glycosyltransferase involved in cell wall biosynthesis